MPRVLRLLLLIAAHLIFVPPALVAIAALSRTQHPVGDLFVQFSAAAFVTSLGVTLVLILYKLTPAAIIGLLVSGLLLLANWPQWAPTRIEKTPSDTGAFSVYTANLYVKNHDIEAMARSIRQADADVLILVEIGQTARDQADQIFTGYPYRLYAGRGDHPTKSAIISRYPLQTIEGPKHPETVAAVVATPLGPVNIIAAHLTRPWPFNPPQDQVDQLNHLNKLRQEIDGPLILAGDFNAVSHGRIGRRVSQDFGLIPAPGYPGTYPRMLPSPIGMTIDHAWYTPDLLLTSRKLGRHTGSDHRPVITHFSSVVTPEP